MSTKCQKKKRQTDINKEQMLQKTFSISNEKYQTGKSKVRTGSLSSKEKKKKDVT